MKNLKSFILGMLTILLFIPLVEQLCEIIVTFMEYLKGLVSKPMLILNKELIELQNETQSVEKIDDGFAIGFQYNPEDLDECGDYEDE